MDLTPLIPAGRQVVESYGERRFRVSGRLLDGSILVFPDRTLAWSLSRIEDVSEASLTEVLRAAAGKEVELLLIGCGSRMAPVPAPLRQALRSAGVVVEAMDTGAACRTYNVLMAEGRHVCAALIAVD